jgi:hypothetical protein
MDDKTFGHGFLALILTRAVLQFSRLSPNMVSRPPSSRFEFLFSIKDICFLLALPMEFPGFESNRFSELWSKFPTKPQIRHFGRAFDI